MSEQQTKKQLSRSTPLHETTLNNRQVNRNLTQEQLHLSTSNSHKKKKHQSNEDARKNKQKKNVSEEIEITRPFNVEHRGFDPRSFLFNFRLLIASVSHQIVNKQF
jgi:hypothetical protein